MQLTRRSFINSNLPSRLKRDEKERTHVKQTDEIIWQVANIWKTRENCGNRTRTPSEEFTKIRYWPEATFIVIVSVLPSKFHTMFSPFGAVVRSVFVTRNYCLAVSELAKQPRQTSASITLDTFAIRSFRGKTNLMRPRCWSFSDTVNCDDTQDELFPK